MALSILDGTQTATTLSTILSSGQHITAHTVVSLGTQAITDMRSAVSGSVVSISSLPAISGTVTANVTDSAFTTQGKIASFTGGTAPSYGVLIGFEDDEGIFQTVNNTGRTLPVNGDVSILGFDTVTGYPIPIQVTSSGSVFASLNSALPAGTNRIGVVTIGGGTVTIGAGTSQIGSVTASISNSVTIAAFATSVTARLINPAGTAVTYAEVGTAGNPSIDVLSVQGVTAGSPVITTLLLSSTAITSGSFTSLTSATLVPANTARKMATVYNLGAGQLFVNAGSSATTLGGGFMVALSSGDFYECDYTTTTLSAIFATAGTASWVSH